MRGREPADRDAREEVADEGRLAEADGERAEQERGGDRGERIGLTTTEFDILRHLAARPGRVYTRVQLLELVRDYDDALEQDERTINVHISHIRDKIEPDPAHPSYIRTVRGVGYAFTED